MRPLPVKFHIYAEDETEIQDLQNTLYDFMTTCYQEGIYVRARKLTDAVRQYGNNPMIKNYLK